MKKTPQPKPTFFPRLSPERLRLLQAESFGCKQEKMLVGVQENFSFFESNELNVSKLTIQMQHFRDRLAFQTFQSKTF